MPAVPEIDDLFRTFAAEAGVPHSFYVPANDGITISHDSVNAAGAADENIIYLTVDKTATIAAAATGYILKLIAGRSVFIPGGPHTVQYICTTGAPTFSVIRRR